MGVDCRRLAVVMAVALCGMAAYAVDKPWSHGALRVSDNHLYLQHEDGTPFFWLGDTGWLLPQRLDRDEVEYYMRRTADAGYNVVQIQVLNGVPSFNRYGRMSHPAGWDMSQASKPGEYGYWEHLDYIVDVAESHGIYIGMVCIWGGLVKAGLMDEEQARDYGRFLSERYGNCKNIVWIIGGDIQGNIKTGVWEALAGAIREVDHVHLMTFHPRGRTTSARWFNDKDWLDFNMFQSGHRRYDQRMGNKDYPIPDGTEEDSWMYVDSAHVHAPLKPVLDGEPSYEDIPQGLHSADEPLWNARDVRRYAYWSVFAGSCGHTYGHNAIMQFVRPGIPGAYFADGEKKPWYRALDDSGRNQMRHLKHLMLAFPYFDRVADSTIVINNGIRYNRLIATRGNDYLMVYNHTGRAMELDFSRISGAKKRVWSMNPVDGSLSYVGETAEKRYHFMPQTGSDIVLIAVDSKCDYLLPSMSAIPVVSRAESSKNLTE